MSWRMKESRSRKLLCICILSLLILVVHLPASAKAQDIHEDLTGVKVAIYNGQGVMESSRIALSRMFEWMNASVDYITASQIQDDILDAYDIFVVPGGSESTCSSELDSEGKQKVRDFIAEGGSYFGICGGATFGVTYLRLFNGFISPGSEEGALIHMTTMKVNQSSTGPDLSNLPANITIMYYAAQYFTPKLGTVMHTIATYEYNGKPGMIAFDYGNGTVFLSSPHPEFEENSDRDATSEYDYLDDSDSEWDLLLKVSEWLVETSDVESTTTTTPNTSTLDLPLIAITSTGFVMIILAVAFIFRRTHE